MKAERAWGEEYRTTTICIDSYENAVPVGRIYNPYLKEGLVFHSTTQLLLEMERVLDRMNLPASFTASRMFAAPPEHDTGPPPQQHRPGELATFAVKILFRQHASWQGCVAWLEGRQEQSFRSVLELILLMDSAIQAEEKAS